MAATASLVACGGGADEGADANTGDGATSGRSYAGKYSLEMVYTQDTCYSRVSEETDGLDVVTQYGNKVVLQEGDKLELTGTTFADGKGFSVSFQGGKNDFYKSIEVVYSATAKEKVFNVKYTLVADEDRRLCTYVAEGTATRMY
ncbi:hypothetical protein [Hydrogenophaga sp. 5NK40-0174]|uniref:hypothetical protein n=1 Tax=Hydrogenophaga sp. 5NK40-0174 TaxID=3127649 RepID=UPI00333ED4FA